MISMTMDIGFPFPPNGDYLRGTYQSFDQSNVKKSKPEELTNKSKMKLSFLQVLGEIEGMECRRMKGVLRRWVGRGERAEDGGERREGELEVLQI